MFRHALQTYIDSPTHPRVVHHTADVVVVSDAYPKAMRHLLVIPRADELTFLHPLRAFRNNPEAYAAVAAGVDRAKDIIVEQLTAAGYVLPDAAAQALFRNTFIRAGVHAEPSLANLHVHVITQDFCLPLLKTRRHYTSFTTDFFVDFASLDPALNSAPDSDSPTDTDGEDTNDMDPETTHARLHQPVWESAHGVLVARRPRAGKRAHPVRAAQTMACRACRRTFIRMPQLKAHLRLEFEVRFNRAPPE